MCSVSNLKGVLNNLDQRARLNPGVLEINETEKETIVGGEMDRESKRYF